MPSASSGAPQVEHFGRWSGFGFRKIPIAPNPNSVLTFGKGS